MSDTKTKTAPQPMSALTVARAVACAATTLTITAASPALGSEVLTMQSYAPSSLPILGDSGQQVADRIAEVTNGELVFQFNEPGAIVSAGEIWDAVSTGAIDAGWSSPGLADSIIPSASIFTAVPFGGDARTLTAWWYNGGGAELWAEISDPFNVHTELCGIIIPEASGWFREPIESVDQLEGLRMRIFGLGAQALQRLGVEAQSMSIGDTMTGLRLGTIDAAEISFPSVDVQLGMFEHAAHLYFPGWHQQASTLTLFVNRDRWNSLSEQDRAAVREVCAANVALTSARGEADQLEAIATLEEQGVTIHQWSDELLDAFEGAWEDVVAERSAADADFARAWQSFDNFRTQHQTWVNYGYLR